MRKLLIATFIACALVLAVMPSRAQQSVTMTGTGSITGNAVIKVQSGGGGGGGEAVVYDQKTNFTDEVDGGWTSPIASDAYGRSTQTISTANNTNGIEFTVTGTNRVVFAQLATSSGQTQFTCNSADSLSIALNAAGSYDYYTGNGTSCTNQGSGSYSAGDTFRISADGKLYKNGVLVYTAPAIVSPAKAFFYGGSETTTAVTSATITY